MLSGSEGEVVEAASAASGRGTGGAEEELARVLSGDDCSTAVSGCWVDGGEGERSASSVDTADAHAACTCVCRELAGVEAGWVR